MLEPALGPRPCGHHAWPRSLSLTPKPLRDASPACLPLPQEKRQNRPCSSSDTPSAWLPHETKARPPRSRHAAPRGCDPHPRGRRGQRRGPRAPSRARANSMLSVGGSPWRWNAGGRTLLFRAMLYLHRARNGHLGGSGDARWRLLASRPLRFEMRKGIASSENIQIKI